MRCSAWRELADHCAQSLTKGMRVIAQGRLQQRSYQANDGTNRTVVEMQVDEIGPSLRYATAQVHRQSSGFSGGQSWRIRRRQQRRIPEQRWVSGRCRVLRRSLLPERWVPGWCLFGAHGRTVRSGRRSVERCRFRLLLLVIRGHDRFRWRLRGTRVLNRTFSNTHHCAESVVRRTSQCQRKRPQPPVKPFKKKPNPLKAAKVTEIDYKDVALLRKFISDRGKIRSRRITGVTVQEQREISKTLR